MSNFSKSTSFLDRFSSDLNSLYCFTKDARIESLFIKVAESNEAEIQEFLNALYAGKFKKLNHLKNVIDALKNLQKTPLTLAPSEFVSYALREFPTSIPTIICLRELRSLNLPILYPVSKQLALSVHFQRGKEDVEGALKDLTVINNELQSFLKAKAEREYEDEFVAKKPKQTKKEKIKTMAMFLFDRFSNEVVSGFQNSHLSSIASEVGMNLRSPTGLLKIFQNTSSNNIDEKVVEFLTREAFNIGKTVLGKIEPHNFESNYALIKGQIFRLTGAITQNQFYTYYQKVLEKELNQTYGVSHDNGNDMELEDLNINPNQWANPMAVIFLSLILTKIFHAGAGN